MNIYVVMGTTGEYSDRREWPVRAFRDKGRAEGFVALASKRAKAIEAHFEDCEHRYSLPADRPCQAQHENDLDANFDMDYTGTGYYAMEVALEDA